MPRIDLATPQGTLGGQVAQPGRAPLPTAGQFGAGIGREVEGLGAQALAGLQGEQQRLEEFQQRQELERQREAKQAENEARRVAALTATARAQNGLNDLTDEISTRLADGTLGKDDARQLYTDRAREITAGSLDIVDATHRPLVEATLADNVMRGSQSVRKLVEVQDHADLLHGTNAYMEEMQRFAARGPQQAEQAMSNVDAFVGSIAGRAGMDGQKTLQGFKEGVRFNQATQMVNNDPAAALKFLKNADNFPELDPGRRTALVAEADAAVLRNQHRAEMERQRIERMQQQMFDTASKVFESGRAFDAGYMSQVRAQLKGSIYEPAVEAMIQSGPQNVAAATLPVQVQSASIDALRSKGNEQGTNPALEAEIDRRTKVLSQVQQAVDKDALGAANDYGIVRDLRPLQISGAAGLPEVLAERKQQARTAQVWTGQPVSPLRPSEAEQLQKVLAQLPPDQRAGALAMIGGAIDDKDQITALARQIDAKDRNLATAMMYADAKTTKGRNTSELILRGAQAQRDGTVKEEKQKGDGWRAKISQAIGDAYPNEELRSRMVDAAYMITLGVASTGESPDTDQAVNLATGGIRANKDGSKVPLPYGWKERDFDKRLGGLQPKNITAGAEVFSGKTPIPVATFIKQLPNATLLHAGQGRYAVRAGSGFITDKNGGRIIIDLGE